ncbi:MAG: biotin/lipoyl-containing protein, partial [Gammaproteobacteria bacterium]
ARALGLERRWRDVEKAYAAVNDLFGDVIKVTPTSKVVGDMALYMVSTDMTPEEVSDPARDVAFPQSVVEYFRGDLGQPPGGFPEALQRKILKDEQPLTARAGASMSDVDLEAERAEAEHKLRRHVDDRDLASYLMYPAVFLDYDKHRRQYGQVRVLPTPLFFYGLEPGQEVSFDIQRGMTLIVTYVALSEPDDHGHRTVFFELNGQPRTIKVPDRSLAASVQTRRQADQGDAGQIGAPMPGMIVTVAVTAGQPVKLGDPLFTIEAMKMETAVPSPVAGVVDEIVAGVGARVETRDLIMTVRQEVADGG